MEKRSLIFQTIPGADITMSWQPFMYGYSGYYFTIEDSKAKIKITKDVFENIPNWYKFNDIIVQ